MGVEIDPANIARTFIQVTAEDLPDLTDSCLANSELQESLR
jgi:hypothetical protein